MRLNIYDLFTVGVVRPKGGRSKGRSIAFIEERDRCVPLVDLVIPDGLDDAALAAYVGNRFTAFARPGKRIVPLVGAAPRPLRQEAWQGEASQGWRQVAVEREGSRPYSGLR